MLGVIILHEPMAIRENITNEKEECLIQDFNIQLFNQCSFEDTYASASSLAYPCPDMYLHWMLRPVCVCGWVWAWVLQSQLLRVFNSYMHIWMVVY